MFEKIVSYRDCTECLERFSACFQEDFPFEAQAKFVRKLAVELGADNVPPVERISDISFRSKMQALNYELIFGFSADDQKWELRIKSES